MYDSTNYGAPVRRELDEDAFVDLGADNNDTGVVTAGQDDRSGTAQFEFYVDEVTGGCQIVGTAIGSSDA